MRHTPVNIAVGLILAAIVGSFLLVQVRIHRGIYGESDSRAYLALAKRLATGGPLALAEPDPFLHHDHAWVQTAQGKLAPKFPPGYPLMLVPLYWVAGDDGMAWGSPLFGALALVGAFFLFREWMSRVAALAATAALGMDSFIVFFSCYVLPHSADLCVVVWGMACLWRWLKRGQLGWGIGAGLLLGFAVLVRPANAVLGLPLAIVWCRHAWLVWRSVPCQSTGFSRTFFKAFRPGFRDLAWVAGSYAFMLLLLLAYQAAAFGSPLTSGYTLAGESQAFAWSFFSQRFSSYLDVWLRFVGVAFVVGGMGLLLIGSGWDRLLRFLWVASLMLLYSCYYWDAYWFHWLLRFLLVIFPVFYGAMFGWVDSASGRWGKYAVIVLLLVLPFLPVPRFNKGGYDVVANVRTPTSDERGIRSLVEARLKKEAVIFADEGRRDALESRKGFRVYDLSAFKTNHVIAYSYDKPNREPKMQVSRQRELEAFYKKQSPDALLAMKRKTVAGFLEQGRQVVFIAGAKQLESERVDLAPEVELTVMASAETATNRSWIVYEAKRNGAL